MIMNLPWSEACERNRQPIADCLQTLLPAQGLVLEIGSCTGQHVVYFAERFPDIEWQPSDREEYLDGLQARLRTEGGDGIRPALELDVLKQWPAGPFDVVYTANTCHIMHWAAVQAMFRGASAVLIENGLFCLYGPYMENGDYTSESNRAFDRSLKARDPGMGQRDLSDLDELAARHQMVRIGRHRLPANNQLLVYRRKAVINGDSDV